MFDYFVIAFFVGRFKTAFILVSKQFSDFQDALDFFLK